MENELVQIEQAVHHCTYVEIDGVQQLRHLIQQVRDLILQNWGNEEDAEILQEAYLQVEDAKMHLDRLRPDDLNINDWKYNIEAFSKAKAHVLYPLTLLKAAMRFGHLHLKSAEPAL